MSSLLPDLVLLCPAPARDAFAAAIAGDPNARDGDGNTVAHTLAALLTSGDDATALFTALKERGAELSALNLKAATPLEVAGTEEVRQALRALGATSARQAVKPTPVHKRR